MAYNVNFKKGTAAQYIASARDAHTFYFVDEKDLYLGAIKISNDADLQAALERITTAEGNISSNDADILQLQKDLAALIGSGEGSISEQLAALETKLHGEIEDVQGSVDAEKQRAQAAEGALETRIETAEGKVTALETLTGTHTTNIANNAEAIAENAEAISGLNDSVSALQQKDTNLENRLSTAEGKITTLVGEDTGKSVRDVAAEETAKIVAGADEKYDTLKEIADFITSDITGSAGLVSKVEDHEDRIKTAEDELDALELRVKTNEDNISQLQKDVDAVEITVGQHTDKLAELESADATNLQAAKDHTNQEVGKVNNSLTQGLAEAATARAALNDLITANTNSISANAQAIAAINNTETGILAQAKAYSNENLATAKSYTDEKLTWQALA